MTTQTARPVALVPVTLVPLTPAAPGTARPAAPARSTRTTALRAELRAELPWLLLSVGTAVGAAAATSAWLVESVHLF